MLQELASPDRPGPPAFAPPPPALGDQSGDAAPHLAITQPTPSEEDGGGIPTTEDLQGTVLNATLLYLCRNVICCQTDVILCSIAQLFCDFVMLNVFFSILLSFVICCFAFLSVFRRVVIICFVFQDVFCFHINCTSVCVEFF